MARIWNVRLNVDALNAAVAGLECDAERLAFFAGFHGGLNGKQKADKGEPWVAGWAVANECLAEAVAFSEKQRAKVNKRYHGTTVVEPRNYCGTTAVLPIQQSTIYNLQTTNGNTKKEEVETPSARPKRFIPPTVAEVESYCASRGNGIDAEQFMNRYESNGWLVGKSPMKNWQAAVRTWERNNFGDTTRKAQAKTSSYDEDVPTQSREQALELAAWLESEHKREAESK